MDLAVKQKEDNDLATHRAIFQFSDKYTQQDSIAQYQFAKTYNSKPRAPEHDLQLAVLEQGIKDYLDLLPKKGILVKEFNEINNWFFKEKNEEIGGFYYICDLLEIDKYYIIKTLEGLTV